MMVGALTYARSACFARYKHNGSYGLSAINVKMHAGYIKSRAYHYFTRSVGGWTERTLPMKRHPFYEGTLSRAEANIYFTAGILKVFEAQCPDIDGAWESLPHRHPVSHFYWGDRVRGTDAEDRVFAARRRLIAYYAKTYAKTVSYDGLTLQSPLDGGIRKLTSKFGDDRGGGRRRHMGIDFSSGRGEPVRAVADGVVTLAGVQLKTGTRNMGPRTAEKVPRAEMAAGGLLVMVAHSKELKSAYMHLDGYVVTAGQKVTRGQLLGFVGRSGIRESAAHLHFEIRKNDRQIDPEPALKGRVISPLLTHRGKQLDDEQRRLRRKRRRRPPGRP